MRRDEKIVRAKGRLDTFTGFCHLFARILFRVERFESSRMVRVNARRRGDDDNDSCMPSLTCTANSLVANDKHTCIHIYTIHLQNMDSDNDSMSSSSSSDDGFLTLKSGQGGTSSDREAMIRRKLLESFYGASVPQDDVAQSEQSDDDYKMPAVQKEEDETEEEEEESEDRPVDQAALEDVDSPYFAVEAHTEQHVLRSDMHTLLETEERLSLQVRTLDSTMQTLVYENYSKFISATDAIRSIGVSVNAKEEGMQSLSRGMKVIDEQTRQVEDELGSLRDAVAEKVRVKRLLTRLDSLLKLPETLQQDIANGNYRKATKSYLSAHSILSKHSVGFESLKTIETECHDILAIMVKMLRRKLVHWSAHNSLLLESDEGSTSEEDWEQPPEPPKTMSEIFECAGTLFLLLPQEENNERTSFDSGFSADECKSMALFAAVRLLERQLDAHQIELQDAMFATPGFEDDTYEAKINSVVEPEAQAAPKGSNLIPTVYLDSVLEAATLYGLSFGSGSSCTLSDTDSQRLVDFVSEAYSGFLAHVRAVLLEHCLQAEPVEDAENEALDDMDDDGEDAYGEVSGAMAFLLRSVRDLASGLALPEIGVDVEFAASLVDQAVEVTEAMVRRRVAEKFFVLRQHVVQDCLAPFVQEAIAHPSDNDARVVDVVQMASVALSDGMQLVDDTVRGILSGDEVVSSSRGAEIEMIKEAVQGCSRRFAVWLACTLERLAGCESSDSKMIIEAEEKAEDIEDDVDGLHEDEDTVPSHLVADGMSDISDLHDALVDKVESSLDDIFDFMDDAPDEIISELTLAIAEMCRLAERSIMENIQNSITSSMEGDKKAHKSSHMFSMSKEPSSRRFAADRERGISDRFHLAASRVLALYTLNHGSSAGFAACETLYDVASSDGEEIPVCPRPGVCKLLESVKHASLDCAYVFGGEKRANPVPEFPEDQDDFYPSPIVRSGKSLSARMPTVKGLQLDVERMFSEKVPTYPHPCSVLEFTREYVVAMVMKVAYKALEEQARSCSFSASGYRQLQVDVALLRHMIPHYIKDDYDFEGTNACVMVGNILNDVMTTAGERCMDEESIGCEELRDTTDGSTKSPLDIVRFFMTNTSAAAGEKESKTLLFVIDESDE